jgi:hypothetical protein
MGARRSCIQGAFTSRFEQLLGRPAEAKIHDRSGNPFQPTSNVLATFQLTEIAQKY